MFDDYGFIQKESKAAHVDMGPLLDMVFILLIFFVITTNFTRETGIDVDKPQAASSVAQGNETILVGVSREGSIHIHGRQVDTQELERLLRSERARIPSATVIIVGDRGSPLGRSVEIMDIVNTAGFDRVSLAADRN
ncbi:ExbD/TolR family protein [Chitinivibrio alkaliphilus]|uniref:Biopolymer transport protein ExbD/TolR n=1 Tax=Chitinivibrio alkaliphilus ACht1 TaxID=1313304 RepID=U7DAM8_9BACT|nr:biopolymer transporter ExbD [Chitinivibrio alkaliphilus]ERP31450.1 Biopolymer transport protein ExbD/TolR [Chitinivibrio alkaliphilus ACht1]